MAFSPSSDPLLQKKKKKKKKEYVDPHKDVEFILCMLRSS